MKLILLSLMLVTSIVEASPFHSYAGSSLEQIDILVDTSVRSYWIEHPFNKKDSLDDIEIRVKAVAVKWARDYDLTPAETRYYMTNFVDQVMNACYECPTNDHNQ